MAIDIHVYIFAGILTLKIQQERDNKIRNLIINCWRDKDNALFQEKRGNLFGAHRVFAITTRKRERGGMARSAFLPFAIVSWFENSAHICSFKIPVIQYNILWEEN